MAPLDPISADPEDEGDAQRLRAFFSAASAQRPSPPRPAAPTAPAAAPAPAPALEERPAPTGAPVFDTDLAEAAEPLDPTAPVDLARLVTYLDAQLELTRQRVDDGVGRVLAALAALDGRVGELETFRDDLFDWLESYVGWEATTLAEIASRLGGAPPRSPGPAGAGGLPST
jgi:hypothetical protein